MARRTVVNPNMFTEGTGWAEVVDVVIAAASSSAVPAAPPEAATSPSSTPSPETLAEPPGLLPLDSPDSIILVSALAPLADSPKAAIGWCSGLRNGGRHFGVAGVGSRQTTQPGVCQKVMMQVIGAYQGEPRHTREPPRGSPYGADPTHQTPARVAWTTDYPVDTTADMRIAGVVGKRSH